MKQLNTLTALACGFLLSWPSVGQAQQAGVLTVEVFANSAMHITPAQTSGLPFKMDLYRLDAMQNAELRERLFRFEVEILKNDLADISIYLALTERVLVTVRDGVATVEAVAEPDGPASHDEHWLAHHG